MDHALIAENVRDGSNFLERLNNHYTLELTYSINKTYIHLPYSGRVDSIYLVNNESRALGNRFNGQILRSTDSYAIDGLLMYVTRGLYPMGRRSINVLEDPESYMWTWYEDRDTYFSRRIDPPLIQECWDSILTEGTDL